MLSKLTTNQKMLIGISGLILLLAIPICIASIFLVTAQRTPQATSTPALNITYCGANPQEICVYSFGRNGTGDTVITFYIPKDFPNFYLNIKKTSGVVLYECKKNKDLENNATCIGQSLLLGEQIEITILSIDGDIPIAVGKFAVTAILILSPTQDESTPHSLTSTPDSAPQSPTKTRTPTRTPTPSTSYPNNYP